MLKKLNIAHTMTILALPILLALINPNWIFNVNMVDDYVYLGYQMDLPKYLGWNPSNDGHVIERWSAILPGYVVRELFPPLTANFILHLGVYYLAIFSVYGILNRLLNAKVAIIIALLFGQYPLIMRATGWDYPDGYALGYFGLTILFLCYSVGSTRRHFYLMGAGGAFMLMITAHFFNLFYFPALLVFYLFITRWTHWRYTLLAPVMYGGVGAFLVYALLATIHYGTTGNILFVGSIRLSLTLTPWLKHFLVYNFSKIDAHWHFLLLTVATIILIRPLLWNKLSAVASQKPQFDNIRVIYRALVGMFVCAYLIFAVWYFRGYIYLRVSYYHANIILLAFLVLGVLFSGRISDYPHHQFKYAIAGAFFIPIIPFAVFSLTPQHILITNFWILYGGAIVCMVIALYPKRTLYGLFGFIMFTGAMLQDARHYRSWLYPAYHDVYVADRYMNQSNYEYATYIMQIINNRYDSLSYETFRLFYNQQDSIHSRLFNSVASSYLWTTENRILIPSAGSDLLIAEAHKTQELIVLSSAENTASILEGLNAILDVTELDRYAIGHSRGDIDLIFFRVNKDT